MTHIKVLRLVETKLLKVPFTQAIAQVAAQAILRAISWKLDVTLPNTPKFVLVGAPHTSGWDLFYTLLMTYASGIKLHWIGKKSLFTWPLGGLLRRLGGIPVDRGSKNDFVAQIVRTFHEKDHLIVAIAPEGTRSKADYWKTGFYYIALNAAVPIALGYLDYRHKVIGIGPTLIPTGDLKTDFVVIQEFYATKTGKNPHLQGKIKLRED